MCITTTLFPSGRHENILYTQKVSLKIHFIIKYFVNRVFQQADWLVDPKLDGRMM
jgi:hypothetical protein